MLTMTAEDDLERIIDNVEQAEGRDMSEMRLIAKEVLSLETGDSTPLPGTLLRAPEIILPPAICEGMNEAPEGKFYRPPFGRPKGHHYNVGDIAKRLYRTRVWVAILTMYAISATVVAVWNW